jgi:hypothetical protein
VADTETHFTVYLNTRVERLPTKLLKTFTMKQSKRQLNSKRQLKQKKSKKGKKKTKNKEPKIITLWDKIEKSLNQERIKLKIKKKYFKQELIISCMHIITGTIKRLNAYKDQTLQDQIITTFMESFNNEIIKSGSNLGSWKHVTSSIIINTTDPLHLFTQI